MYTKIRIRKGQSGGGAPGKVHVKKGSSGIITTNVV